MAPVTDCTSWFRPRPARCFPRAKQALWRPPKLGRRSERRRAIRTLGGMRQALSFTPTSVYQRPGIRQVGHEGSPLTRRGERRRPRAAAGCRPSSSGRGCHRNPPAHSGGREQLPILDGPLTVGLDEVCACPSQGRMLRSGRGQKRARIPNAMPKEKGNPRNPSVSFRPSTKPRRRPFELLKSRRGEESTGDISRLRRRQVQQYLNPGQAPRSLLPIIKLLTFT